VRIGETNADEPPMRCRKAKNGVKTGSLVSFQDEPGGKLHTDPGGIRHKGGVNPIQAYVRNAGTCAPMRREKPEVDDPSRQEYRRGAQGRNDP
jgi:hypothetical protein